MSIEYIIALLVSLTVGLILYLVLVPRRGRKETQSDSNNPFIKAANIFGEELYSALPEWGEEKRRSYPKINDLIRRANNPWNITAQEFIFISVFSGVLGGAIGLGVGLIIARFTGLPFIIFLALFAAIGSVFPYFSLKGDAENRENSFRSEMPEALDLMTLSLAGGRGFPAALRETVGNLKDSPLRDEFSKMIISMDTGKSLSQALEDFRQTAPTEAFRVFIQAVQEATSLNVSLVEVMKAQSRSSRKEQFSHIQQTVAKLPSQLNTVLSMSFLFGILLVTVTPAILQLVNAL